MKVSSGLAKGLKRFFRGFVLSGMLSAITSCGFIGGAGLFGPSDASSPTAGRAGWHNAALATQARAVRLPAPKLQRTPEVDRELKLFSGRGRRSIAKALDRSRDDRQRMAEIFAHEGVPVELLTLAYIESGYRSDARSGAGAVGMWQFMKSTARIYGLSVNWFQDQRRDPMLSTVAAAKHLRDLYTAYSDWNLALAAYNAGTAAVDRAIIRSGSRDFWTLARTGRLRRETCKFVPRFIAASLVHSSLEDAAYAYRSTGTRNG